MTVDTIMLSLPLREVALRWTRMYGNMARLCRQNTDKTDRQNTDKTDRQNTDETDYADETLNETDYADSK